MNRPRSAWRGFLAAPPIRRLRAMGRVAAGVAAGYSRNDGAALAGYIAYAGFLAIFPFAIFATALIGRVAGQSESVDLVRAVFDVTPPHVAQTLEPVIAGVVAGSQGGILTASGLGALWVATNAVEAVRMSFDRAYGVQTPRAFHWRRLRGLAVVALAVTTFALLGVSIIGAPLAMRLLAEIAGVDAPTVVGVLRYFFGAGAVWLFLTWINLLLPSRRPPPSRLWPGVALSTLLLLAGATGFSVYLAYAPDYTLTYGAFAGVIVTLLFFYLGGVAIILGAELNAALLRWRPHTSARGAGRGRRHDP